jgi:hypothetical protein
MSVETVFSFLGRPGYAEEMEVAGEDGEEAKNDEDSVVVEMAEEKVEVVDAQDVRLSKGGKFVCIRGTAGP